MAVLVVRGLLRRPSLSGTPTVTFCSVHIHNVVAQKSDASTDLLRRLHAHITQCDVDFIGGDFNMSAFSTLGDVFADQSFGPLATRSCGVLAPWKTRIASALGFSSRPSDHFNGVWTLTAATNSTTRILRLDLVTPRPTFLFFSTSAHHQLPGP